MLRGFPGKAPSSAHHPAVNPLFGAGGDGCSRPWLRWERAGAGGEPNTTENAEKAESMEITRTAETQRAPSFLAEKRRRNKAEGLMTRRVSQRNDSYETSGTLLQSHA